MPWIENASLANIKKGHHFEPGPNSMLIQIVDPDMEFPVAKCSFRETHKFKFLDIEEDGANFAVTQEQAKQIVLLLNHALKNRMNVIVHCHAGICRSGAVAEVGIIMGFTDTEVFRMPNLLVKQKMLQHLTNIPTK